MTGHAEEYHVITLTRVSEALCMSASACLPISGENSADFANVCDISLPGFPRAGVFASDAEPPAHDGQGGFLNGGRKMADVE